MVEERIFTFYLNNFVFIFSPLTSYSFNITMTCMEAECQNILEDDFKNVVSNMFSNYTLLLTGQRPKKNILQLKLLQNALTEHLVFANKLCGLKVDLNVVWIKKHGTVRDKIINWFLYLITRLLIKNFHDTFLNFLHYILLGLRC